MLGVGERFRQIQDLTSVIGIQQGIYLSVADPTHLCSIITSAPGRFSWASPVAAFASSATAWFGIRTSALRTALSNSLLLIPESRQATPARISSATGNQVFHSTGTTTALPALEPSHFQDAA